MESNEADIDQNKVWSKIFGIPIPSHTYPGTMYHISMTSDGWSCDCMDFKIRKGSYEIVFDTERFQSCKHVIDWLRDLYYDDMKQGKKHDFKYRKEYGNWKRPEPK